MQNPEPKVPKDIHPLAREILEQLQTCSEAASIILGGGVALQHYCPFRQTKDIDAWWQQGPERATQDTIQDAMRCVAAEHDYQLKIRSWGETESYELQQDGRTIFSFQIALRTTELEPAKESAWSPVKIESFRENLAAKMNALVSRSAPRDLLDVFEVCHRGLATAGEC